jgi:hypothetical protein
MVLFRYDFREQESSSAVYRTDRLTGDVAWIKLPDSELDASLHAFLRKYQTEEEKAWERFFWVCAGFLAGLGVSAGFRHLKSRRLPANPKE